MPVPSLFLGKEIVHLFRVVLEIVVVLASLVKRPVAGGAKHFW